ncbi:MAG: bacillithiol biosynthesis cysteine-adding enzyme BshC [Bacteroidota bacterium]
MNWIDFREISNTVGGFSSLYCDYLHQYENVQQYYNGDFRSSSDIGRVLNAAQSRLRDRKRLSDILRRQNQAFGCGEQTLENIAILESDSAFAVVTGQQVGILGGPIYTLYKIITAIKLSRELNRKYPSFRFVPVFWIEAEDHDFEEVNSVTVISRENLATRIEYLIDGKRLEKNLGAVGDLRFESSLSDFFQKLDDVLINTEFKPSLLSMLKTYYAPGASLSTSFVGLLNSFFQGIGLVYINSNDKELKDMLVPIFQREIQNYPRIGQAVIDRSAEIEERYHAQVKPKAVNLFLFHKGGRYLVEPRDREKDFALKGTRHHLTREELESIATVSPEMLSPNVVLRPICQDYLLPTAMYVAGPSEIAYFAQLKPVYKYYDVTMPIIYPRSSVTLLEHKVEKVLEKYQLPLVEFFGEHESIWRKVIDQLSDVNVDGLFTTATKDVENGLSQLDFGLSQIDQTLSGPLEATRSKMNNLLSILKDRTQEAQKKKHDLALRQIQKVTTHVCPNSSLQERQLNVVYFLNKYGLEFVQWLTGEVQIDKFKHQVIVL